MDSMLRLQPGASINAGVDSGVGIMVVDDVLPPARQRTLLRFLQNGAWTHGWRSRDEDNSQKFWHRHLAGSVGEADARLRAQRGIIDCAPELAGTAPLVFAFWRYVQGRAFQDHVLSRCYANALPYGTDGGVHIDSLTPGDYTAVYYPHLTWHPDWGGETIIFNQDCSDILTAVYPKPNRLFVFPGFVNHVARGISKNCPHMRITLMFKTQKSKLRRGPHDLPR
ncbi:hypothetical protein [Bradyrhizobium sp. USDA 4454]